MSTDYIQHMTHYDYTPDSSSGLMTETHYYMLTDDSGLLTDMHIMLTVAVYYT
jgi:hypothetical protein